MARRDVLILSTTDWDAPQFGSRQQIARQLVRRGHRVLFAEPPRALHSVVSDPSATWKAVPRMGRIRSVDDGPIVYTPPPVLPLHYHPWTQGVNQRLLSRYLRGALSQVGWQPQIAWTYWPHTGEAIARLGAPLSIYHCVDDFTAVDYPFTPPGTIARLEAAQCRTVDLIFARSPLVARRMRVLNPNTHLLTGGVDVEEFDPDRVRADPRIAALPGPRVGFLGTMDDRFDVDLLDQAIPRLPGATFVFAGPVKRHRVDVRRLHRFANVRFLPACTHERAAAAIAAFDVCTIPYRLTSFTASVTPIKLYEYLAMGKPVVTTDLPYCRREGDSVRTARTPGEFAECLSSALAHPPDEEARRRFRAIACANSWERHVDEIERHLAPREAALA